MVERMRMGVWGLSAKAARMALQTWAESMPLEGGFGVSKAGVGVWIEEF